MLPRVLTAEELAELGLDEAAERDFPPAPAETLRVEPTFFALRTALVLHLAFYWGVAAVVLWAAAAGGGGASFAAAAGGGDASFAAGGVGGASFAAAAAVGGAALGAPIGGASAAAPLSGSFLASLALLSSVGAEAALLLLACPRAALAAGGGRGGVALALGAAARSAAARGVFLCDALFAYCAFSRWGFRVAGAAAALVVALAYCGVAGLPVQVRFLLGLFAEQDRLTIDSPEGFFRPPALAASGVWGGRQPPPRAANFERAPPPRVGPPSPGACAPAAGAFRSQSRAPAWRVRSARTPPLSVVDATAASNFPNVYVDARALGGAGVLAPAPGVSEWPGGGPSGAAGAGGDAARRANAADAADAASAAPGDSSPPSPASPATSSLSDGSAASAASSQSGSSAGSAAEPAGEPPPSLLPVVAVLFLLRAAEAAAAGRSALGRVAAVCGSRRRAAAGGAADVELTGAFGAGGSPAPSTAAAPSEKGGLRAVGDRSRRRPRGDNAASPRALAAADGGDKLRPFLRAEPALPAAAPPGLPLAMLAVAGSPAAVDPYAPSVQLLWHCVRRRPVKLGAADADAAAAGAAGSAAVAARWRRELRLRALRRRVPPTKVLQLANCAAAQDAYLMHAVIVGRCLHREHCEAQHFCVSWISVGRCFINDIPLFVLKTYVLLAADVRSRFVWFSLALSLAHSLCACLANATDRDLWTDVFVLD